MITTRRSAGSVAKHGTDSGEPRQITMFVGTWKQARSTLCQPSIVDASCL